MISKEELLLEDITNLSRQAENAEDLLTLAPVISKCAEKISTEPLLLAGANKALREYRDCFKEHAKIVAKSVNVIDKVRKQTLAYIKFCNAAGKAIIVFNTDSLKYPTKNDEISVLVQYAELCRFLKTLHKSGEPDHRTFIEQFAIIESTETLKVTFFPQFKTLTEAIDDRNMKMQSKAGYWFNILFEFRIIADPDIFFEEQKRLTRSNNRERASVLTLRHKTLRNAIIPGRDNNLYKDNFDLNFYRKAVTEIVP